MRLEFALPLLIPYSQLAMLCSLKAQTAGSALVMGAIMRTVLKGAW